MKARVRILNGYRLLLQPEHPKAMSSKNWKGYVYEHILVAEQTLGRPLQDDEEVHHLDGNRSNNRAENLLVLDSVQHSRLHHWLRCGRPYEGKQDLGSEHWMGALYCTISECRATIQGGARTYCSPECSALGSQKVDRPSREQLAEDIGKYSWTVLGKKYGVSDNAVRKWARKYSLLS